MDSTKDTDSIVKIIEKETDSPTQSERFPIYTKTKEDDFENDQESLIYNISSKELENLASSYKENNSDDSEIEHIKKLGGMSEIFHKLKTSPDEGILTEYGRLEEFGSNKIFIEPPTSYFEFLKESLSELLIIMLLSTAIIQIVIQCTLSEDKKTGWLDGLSIIIALLVVVGVESFTNWEKENKFYKLNTIKDTGIFYKVIRNGTLINLKSDDLLVGDVLFITVGEIMPCDLLLIDGIGIKMDESSLTGESQSMCKENFNNCLKKFKFKKISPIILSGTGCVEGQGKAMVIAVGEKSQKGKIRRMVDNSKDDKTPLEHKLEKLSKKITIFSMTVGVVTFISLTIRLIFVYISEYKQYIHRIKIDHISKEKLINPKTFIFSRTIDNFLISTVIITISLPEGLPMAVALTLAFSVKKMMDKNNLVRKMHSCETMGGANYICTDKTGTLTKNELNVLKILTVEQEITLNETCYDDNHILINNGKIRENHEKYFKNEKYWNLLKFAISLNIDGHIKYFDKPDENGDIEQCETKNKTDLALINFLYRLCSPISIIKKKIPKCNRKQIAFDSNKKRMSTFVKIEENNKYYLYTKGSAENIKKYCKYFINSETGEKELLTKKILEKLNNKINDYNNDMLRSLYVCYKEIKEKDFINIDEEYDKSDLILLAIFGIRDSIRPGVKEAVLQCKQASVNVIMITGDNINTACSIAKECNIIPHNTLLTNNFDDIEESKEYFEKLLKNPPVEINGHIFYKIIGGLICDICKKNTNECNCPKTEAEAEQISKQKKIKKQKIKCDKVKNITNFKKIISKLKIMARSQPIHKYALVLGLKELNYVVAVTGDGTNDAPALSKSDVGFSMFDGTDIAKNSSDIILMDNNFASIVTAIKFGRNIIENLRKFLQFQFVINMSLCSFVIICSCIGSQSPLKTIQMLWIDLIMDSLGSLALATEPPHDELLKRKPSQKNENIINKDMLKHIIMQSLFQFVILMTVYLYGPKFIPEHNLNRIVENELIKKCYGILPGNVTDINKIIYGISTYWKSNVEINLKLASMGQCGNYQKVNDMSQAYKQYFKNIGAPVHLTMLFNIFVLYTLFNQINCRIIGNSYNIFARMKNNRLFIIILVFEFVFQFFIIEYWHGVFKITHGGLTIIQWLICIFFSVFSILLELFLKVTNKF